ncbi:MAG TPA: hypothetical protein VGQ68_03395 [Gaiellaceae bacterium]|nr:hypothetical protein [Gaiellaceae bacterium]
MEGGRPAGGRDRGGARIQAPRPGRARVATGVAALGTAGGLAAYPALQDIRFQWLALGLGACALVLLAAGLTLGWASPTGWGLGALGGQYGVLFAAEGRSLDELTPLYAAGLILVAELAYWSLEPRVPAGTESGLLVRRLAHLTGVCVAAATLAALVLVAAAAGGGGGLALEVLGAAAAVGALGLVAALVRGSALR